MLGQAFHFSFDIPEILLTIYRVPVEDSVRSICIQRCVVLFCTQKIRHTEIQQLSRNETDMVIMKHYY